MIYSTFAFVFGAVLLQCQPSLPAPFVLPLLLPTVWIAWRYRSRRYIHLPALTIAGLLWAALMAHVTLYSELDPALEGRDLHLVGVVESLPDVTSERTRFLFKVENITDGQQMYASPGRVQLSWYQGATELSAGETWQFTVRLKRPHGMANPGTRDYERSLFRKGIRATGYIRANDTNRRIGVAVIGYPFERLRQRIAREIEQALPSAAGNGLIRALVIGDRSGITPAEWRVFRATGTSHLMAISGLHIGIVSGIGFFLCNGLWRRSATLCSRVPAPQAGALAALVGAFCYAGLAGFAIPCIRALVMLSALLGGVLFRRPLQPTRSLCFALLAVTIGDPAAVTSPGFWLSFGAVTVILLGILGRIHLTSARIFGVFKVQWAVALGLAPLLLLLGFDLPLLSPLVNIVAVPLFSLLLVPLALTSVGLLMIWPTLGQALLMATNGLLGQTKTILLMISGFSDPIALSGSPPTWLLMGLLTSVLLLLLPAGIPGRWLGILLVYPLFLYRPLSPAKGEVWMTMLDVGQGLSIVLETADHRLLYDTGPRFPSGFDTGELVVLPFLKARGVEKIDRIIVTNGDMDHRGGLAAVLKAFPSAELLSGEPQRLNNGQPTLCAAGMRWTWDGVGFSILHPATASSWRGNDASCVLAVDTAAGRVLLTGDIEAPAEASLVEKYPGQLHAVVVTIPHHGSASSSRTPFIAATQPLYGLISSGYRNRYGFPRAEVVARWQQQQVKLLNTAESGALSLRFTTDGRIEGPFGYRNTHARYWMTSPF
ncbi:DNA internalization-related competence protein ComEC/Rec2 [Sedimenticola sp.]|uniref:DNA internalization-related competence protein ComEC/Rec2 n=1 Tax=Sedimenticola sp. TaxID=1940285 RepID=UPI003D1445B6